MVEQILAGQARVGMTQEFSWGQLEIVEIAHTRRGTLVFRYRDREGREYWDRYYADSWITAWMPLVLQAELGLEPNVVTDTQATLAPAGQGADVSIEMQPWECGDPPRGPAGNSDQEARRQQRAAQQRAGEHCGPASRGEGDWILDRVNTANLTEDYSDVTVTLPQTSIVPPVAARREQQMAPPGKTRAKKKKSGM